MTRQRIATFSKVRGVLACRDLVGRRVARSPSAERFDRLEARFEPLERAKLGTGVVGERLEEQVTSQHEPRAQLEAAELGWKGQDEGRKRPNVLKLVDAELLEPRSNGRVGRARAPEVGGFAGDIGGRNHSLGEVMKYALDAPLRANDQP